MTKDEDLFADDTDIFADIPKPKEKEPKKKKKVTSAPKKTIFKDDIGLWLSWFFASIFSSPEPKAPGELIV